MNRLFFVIAVFVLCFSSTNTGQCLEGFVFVEGDEFTHGVGAKQRGNPVRIGSFEILDHPITNAEYEIFVDETGYPPPLHWINRRIPSGKEDYPVIFVNRYDVETYLNWLSEKEGRIYRLPTSLEFEYAARGNLNDCEYPWGDGFTDEKANFDKSGDRRFDQWEKYLKPAQWRAKNGYGLFGMAGNVWQMTVDYPDPATTRFKYRVEKLTDLERGIMGGSWARSEEYMKCGYRLSLSPGIRHPDVGFRPVREPKGEEWGVQPRKLCAVSLGEGNILLSWALLNTDKETTRFNIYRANSRNHSGFLVNPEPISTTSYKDSNLKLDSRYQYYIKPVDQSGKEGKRSEWVGIQVSSQASSVIASFHPLFKQGSLVPIFGDLDGDGVLDCVIRMDNGNREMSQDPGLPVQMEAFSSYGRSLWRQDICYHDHCFGSANNVPFNVWDMDHDGKAEIITRMQIDDEVYVAILDGHSGELKYKAKWPEMVSDFSKSSTRIHLSIAYLDGENPAVITQTGLYENEVFVAFDAQLNELWRFESFAETNGSGGHKIEVADVNGDSKQEVFDGTTCLNHDGSLRWSIYKQHPDIVSIHDYLPDRPGLEVFYIVESSVHAGVYMVDANSGEIIWKLNREDDPRWTHGHHGWTADIWDGSPGIECVSNRAGHNDHHLLLFSADGRVLQDPFPYGYTPIEWDGDVTRELFKGKIIGNYNGNDVIPIPEGQPQIPEQSHILMAADLYGDFRDELIVQTVDEDRNQFISVVTACEPSDEQYISQTETLDYRLWLGRNMGGGYRSVYDQALRKP